MLVYQRVGQIHSDGSNVLQLSRRRCRCREDFWIPRSPWVSVSWAWLDSNLWRQTEIRAEMGRADGSDGLVISWDSDSMGFHVGKKMEWPHWINVWYFLWYNWSNDSLISSFEGIMGFISMTSWSLSLVGFNGIHRHSLSSHPQGLEIYPKGKSS